MDLRDQLQNTLGSSYTLERELGGGGMSRVFVAEETSLGRKVVVKVLPHDMAAGVSIERFKREIALAARLQHPHIVPLLSAGDSEGLPYFTMPLIEGESLRGRIAKVGELPIAEGLRILREVASALDYAHEKGIVHRDIKPDNVLLSRGSAMVTDFGVAKALSESSNAEFSGVTSLGVALGTPAYMSPEQATATPNIDARTDIYALGVMAYELFAGRPPFSGRSPQAVLAAQVTEAPEPVQRLRPTLPPSLSALIMRCLEKRPADRPQTAAEVVHALDTITTPSGGTQPALAIPSGEAAAASPAPNRAMPVMIGAIVLLAIVGGVYAMKGRGGGAVASGAKSLAVLAFENKSRDSSFDYLADGMSDEVRSSLTNVPGLSVKARGSSTHFKSGEADIHDVASKLDVQSVLTGTLSKSGTKFRLVAELVSASSGNAIWSGTYERAADQMAAVQDSISRAVVAALHIGAAAAAIETVGGSEARGTNDLEAYDLFLRGQHLLGAYSDSSEFHARDYFKLAVAKDPQFARAHAWLSLAYLTLAGTGLVERASTISLARASLAKAIALDSTMTAVILAKSSMLAAEFKFAEQDRLIATALRAHPEDDELRGERVSTLLNVASEQEALAAAKQVRQRNPLDGRNLLELQYLLYVNHDYAGAVNATKDLLELNPRDIAAYQNLGLAEVFLGHPDSAVTALEKSVQIDPTLYGGRIYLIFGYAAAGRWKDAEAARAQLAKESGSNSPNFQRGYVNLAFGKFDDAANDFARSLAEFEPLVLTNDLPCDPVFDPLKSNPRFTKAVTAIWPNMCPAASKWPIKPRG